MVPNTERGGGGSGSSSGWGAITKLLEVVVAKLLKAVASAKTLEAVVVEKVEAVEMVEPVEATVARVEKGYVNESKKCACEVEENEKDVAKGDNNVQAKRRRGRPRKPKATIEEQNHKPKRPRKSDNNE